MKPYYKSTFLFFIGMIIIVSCFLFPFLKTKLQHTAYINKIEIIKINPFHPNQQSLAEEYHLYLKLETTKESFPHLIPTDVVFPSDSTLIIRGYKGPYYNNSICPHVEEEVLSDTGWPLTINKDIKLSRKMVRAVNDDEFLATPLLSDVEQTFPMYLKDADGKIQFYIHLESNIKPRHLAYLLSVTVTYLKNNKAIQSKTIPIFRY
ncbi:MAG: hypothetical protein QME51_03065 [Planctomycetota bacterium]|nr:hypothetical protein [Planctomycetota bacterium]MDI6787334.1 hypothetical protein [Planctomycetota bacterium]